MLSSGESSKQRPVAAAHVPLCRQRVALSVALSIREPRARAAAGAGAGAGQQTAPQLLELSLAVVFRWVWRWRSGTATAGGVRTQHVLFVRNSVSPIQELRNCQPHFASPLLL